MHYDIKITGDNEDNGLVEFDRLSLLTKSTKDSDFDHLHKTMLNVIKV